EFAQQAEWSHDRSLDWHLLEEGSHDGVRRLVSDLNRLYRSYPELHASDLDPRGFGWIRATDRDRNLFVTLRRAPGEGSGMVVCVANFSGSEWRDIPIGVPKAGSWTEILNTDARHYGGSGVGNLGSKVSEPQECDGYPDRLVISIAADSVIWFYAEG
ncbi:MAG: alpha amylase C-terminal domain-containing protein, partial [Actinomycetota bacterium]|nr:alpha amylase C-terminal domain-containing protein [Actinomycetota bacterium]